MLFTIAAVLAGLVHAYIFVLESLLWGRKKTNRIFGVSPEEAETNRTFAFNQGFYNVFLALGAVGGIGASRLLAHAWGDPITLFCCASMFGAAAVLGFSQPRLLRPALIQGTAPAFALLGYALAHYAS